jgi:hypothetical protein
VRERIKSDPPAGTPAIFNNDLLAPAVRQTVGDDPRAGIGAAAGREADLELYNARWKRVGASRTHPSGNGGSGRTDLQQTPT